MRRKSGKGGVTEANRKRFMGERSIAELNAAEELELKLEV